MQSLKKEVKGLTSHQFSVGIYLLISQFISKMISNNDLINRGVWN